MPFLEKKLFSLEKFLIFGKISIFFKEKFAYVKKKQYLCTLFCASMRIKARKT